MDRECDFIIRDKKKIISAIQVCYEFTKEKHNRETVGLLKAMTELKLTEALILTYEQKDILKSDEKTIIIKPVWKWLLETVPLSPGEDDKNHPPGIPTSDIQ